jgi:hypothetical protein
MFRGPPCLRNRRDRPEKNDANREPFLPARGIVIDIAFAFFLSRDLRKFEESINKIFHKKTPKKNKGKGETARQTDV